jgi:hypothetical protein
MEDIERCQGMVIDRTGEIVPCGREATIFTVELEWYCEGCLPTQFGLDGDYTEEELDMRKVSGL